MAAGGPEAARLRGGGGHVGSANRGGAAGWGRALGLAIVTLAIPDGALAQPKPPPPPPAPSPAPAPPLPPPLQGRTAIARVAESLARDLARAPGRALVASGMVTSDASAPRGAQLSGALAAQLAGRKSSAWRARAEPSPLAAARDAARAEGALVYLTVDIANGKLRVTADVYPVPRSVWARLRDAQPGPIAHAYAEAPLDAEVRSYLDKIPLVGATVDRAKNFEGDVVALACGDLDEDGSPEILVVGRRRVSVVNLRGGRVHPIRSRAWPELSPVAPAPLREPIGFAVLRGGEGRGPAWLDVGLTDRSKSVRLDGKLEVVDTFPGLAVPDGDGSACTRIASMVVTGPVGRCAPADGTPHAPSIGGQYDAFASARLLTPKGAPFVVWAGRERGTLELRDDAGHKAGLESIGAQLAVGDLDQDGEPEVISSLDTQNPLEDAVVVRAWARTSDGPAASRIKEVERFPAGAGVRALAVCPPTGPGRAPFVVATADELWVIH